MDVRDLVTVYTLTDPVRAEIIRSALQAEGIRCFFDGLNVAELAGISAFEIKVQVPAGDADRASRFIESHEAPGPRPSPVLSVMVRPAARKKAQT
jgi:hypothetical protein